MRVSVDAICRRSATHVCSPESGQETVGSYSVRCALDHLVMGRAAFRVRGDCYWFGASSAVYKDDLSVAVNVSTWARL